MATLKRLWPILLLFNLAVVPLSLQGIHSRDTDTFYHLAGGRWMVEHRQVLDHEAFSFTAAGTPWTNYSWLFDCALFAVSSVGGLTGIIAFRALLFVLTANILLLWIDRRTNGSQLVTLGMGLMAFALYYPRGVNIRPHLVSYLFLALTFFLLDRFERRTNSFDPWVPLLCIPWASFHGVEYPIVLAVVAIYGFTAALPSLSVPLGVVARDWTVLRWPLLLGLCALAFLANPFGVRLLATPFLAANMQHIVEMSPYPWPAVFNLVPRLDFRATVFFPLALVAALLVLPGWVARRDLRALLFALLGTALAFRSVRFLVEFAIITIPFVADGLARLQASATERRWAANVALVVLIAYLGLGAATTARARYAEGQFEPLSSTAYPIGPVRLLQREGLGGNLFSALRVAGYVEWELYPRIRISMDMRTPEPFDTQMYWRVQATENLTEFENFQRRWPVDFVLLQRESGLARSLAAQARLGFRLVYADGGYVLFAHERVLANGHENLALTLLNPLDDTLDYVQEVTRQGKAAELQGELARLLAIWPANHLVHRTELALLLASERYATARERGLGLEAAYPREVAYPYDVGRALRALSQPEAAFAEFEKVLRLDPNFGPAYPALAETALRLRRYRRGLEVMEAYRARQNELTARQYLLLGNLRLQTGHRAGAVEAYERALWFTSDQDPLRPDIESNLGGLYVDLGQPEKALPVLDAALTRGHRIPEAEFNRARAWAALGRAEDARAVFARLAAETAVPDAVRSAAREKLQ